MSREPGNDRFSCKGGQSCGDSCPSVQYSIDTHIDYDFGMMHRTRDFVLKASNVTVLALVLLTGVSCGGSRAETSNPNPIEAQAIRDYGRGHQSAVTPPPAKLPQETDEQYTAGINDLFVREQFDELEKIAQHNRTGKERLVEGIWKSFSFYGAIASPIVENNRDTAYEARILTAKKWIAAHPDSATARIALANIYCAYASFARGSGLADSVSDPQWELFSSRTALAKQLLIEAARMKDRDPDWFDVMMQISLNEGWDRSKERELFDQAVAFEPSYYHFYRRYSNYLLPQYYGEPGDIQAFAEEIAANHKEPEGSIFYFEIVSTLSCYCRSGMDSLSKTSWPRSKQGYENLKRYYGVTNLKANRFAFIAFVEKDRTAAHEAFASITSPTLDIWTYETVFDNTRSWANSE